MRAFPRREQLRGVERALHTDLDAASEQASRVEHERQRVATIAERSLGMATPDKTRIVSVEGVAVNRAHAGRTR